MELIHMTSPSPAPTTAATPATPRRPLYWRLWASVPRELLYLLVSFPIAIVAFALTVSLFSAGLGTLPTFFIGVIFLVGALYVSRGVAWLELGLLDWTGRTAIPRPDFGDREARTGFAGWLKSLFANAHYWLALVWALIVNFVVSIVTFVLTTVWFGVAFGGLTVWFWEWFIPRTERDFFLSHWIVELLTRVQPAFDPVIGDAIAQFILGLLFTATLPFVTYGLTTMRWGIARGLLGAYRVDALEQEVATLTESRSAAVAAEGTALRRLERDIHDGPQQRLVRLQMDLAAAERQMESDPEAARKLLEEARQQSKDALEELRALSRGFAPPILLDRGLVAALESLAVRSAVTVRVVSSLPEGTDLPTELERNAYFIAAEGLTNAVKHSGATAIDLRLELRRIPDPDTTWLDVTVTDDGRGGAGVVPGHGIAGLQERVLGLGGTLEISSPAGQGTTLIAHLPVAG